MRLVKQHFRFGLVKQVLQTTYHVATTNYLIAPTILGGLSTLQQSVTVLLETMFVCCVHVHQATAPKLYGAVVLYMDSGVLDKTNKPASTWFNLSEHFVAKSCDSLKRAERSSCFTFFEKIPIWISKKDKNERNEPNRSVSLFTLRGHKDKLETLLQACEKAAPSDTSPCVYHTANDGTACSTSWAMSHMLSTKKASNFCFKDDDNTNGFAFLLNDLKRFLASEAWYKQMNLAYRRGYLLHGPPGTGKTTLIAQLASTLGLNLCVLDLAEPALDDTTLRLRVDNAPKNSIILLEDVDSALRSPSHTTRHDNNNTHEDTPSTWAGGSANPPNDKTFSFLEGMSHKPLSCVTHRGILALLDGQLSNSDAQVFFLTTNFKDALPKNMIRPGRCDVDQKIGLASMAQSKFVFLKFFPEATEDDLAELHRHVKPLTRSMAELEGCCIRYRDSPKLALHNLSLLQDSVTRRSDFFEYLASAGLHKTWFKFVDNHLESLHDVAQLDDEDRKSLKIGVLDVENQAYTPRIAKRFNDFLSFGPQSLANLTRRVPCAQLATILSSEFQIGNAQAMIEAQRVGSAYPNLSWWQLKRATSLCPRNFGGFDDALKLAVKTQKDKRFYTRQNNKLDMKTFCWHAGLWDLHARFGAKTIGDVMRDVNSTGCVNKFRTRITYLTYEEALRVGASLLGTPNYSFVRLPLGSSFNICLLAFLLVCLYIIYWLFMCNFCWYLFACFAIGQEPCHPAGVSSPRQAGDLLAQPLRAGRREYYLQASRRPDLPNSGHFGADRNELCELVDHPQVF